MALIFLMEPNMTILGFVIGFVHNICYNIYIFYGSVGNLKLITW